MTVISHFKFIVGIKNPFEDFARRNALVISVKYT
jgi:hypothetical protein